MPIQITPAVAVPPVKPPPAGSAGEPGGEFAQLMTQRPDEPDVETAPGPEAAAPAGTAGTARGDEARGARLRHMARASAPHDMKVSAQPAARDPAAAAAVDEDTSPGADEAAAAMDPALAQWLAHLHLPAAADAVADPAAAAPGVPADRGAAALGAAADGGAAAPDGPPDAASSRADAQGADPDAGAGARCGGRLGERPGRDAVQAALARAGLHQGERPVEQASAGAQATLRDQAATAAAPRSALPSGFEAAAATAQAAGAAAPAPADTTAATVASLPVPVDSPEFAQAFGVQVSVLARDGVHEAELHLNPAEMGPVSVQIALDGERARIDFGAQAAATRSAIEAGLPELAAALRDAGLTLSGGGVSQHTPGRGETGRQGVPGSRSASRERAASQAPEAIRPAWRGRASAGGVDLYA